MSESKVLAEIESAASHVGFCVLPRNPKSLPCSVWSMPDPHFHVGVIWRQNTGAVKIGRRFVRFGVPGLPDFIGWLFPDRAKERPIGQFLTIEAKSGRSTRSPDQAAFGLLAAKTGVVDGVAASYDEAIALFRCWGLNK